jgi:hypothetical protein
LIKDERTDCLVHIIEECDGCELLRGFRQEVRLLQQGHQRHPNLTICFVQQGSIYNRLKKTMSEAFDSDWLDQI